MNRCFETSTAYSLESDIEAFEASNELQNIFSLSIGAHSPAVLLYIAACVDITPAPILGVRWLYYTYVDTYI